MSRPITLVNEDRLCVISDLHLGNPSFLQGRSFNSFLEYLSGRDMSLCINGDGLDLLHLSFPRLMNDLPPVIERIRDFFSGKGIRIYYVVGNHDIYLESFLEGSGVFTVVPFLDVVSGGRRIHIEHGHLYDRLFLYHPGLYVQLTKMSGLCVKLFPMLFPLWEGLIHRFLQFRKRGRKDYIDRPAFMSAAGRLFARGFDAVIFGHSHHSGLLSDGETTYANAGSWLGREGHYIEIEMGGVRLKKWD